MLIKVCLSALLICTTCLVNGQDRDEGVLIEKRSLSADDIRNVEAITEGGNILVEGVDESSARLEVYAWSRSVSKDNMKQHFSEYYDLEMNNSNKKLFISAKRKNRNRKNTELSVSFRIYVPSTVSTDLKTSGGNIHCRSLSDGKHQVETSGGNLAFDQVKGKVSGKTSGGNIAIKACSEDFNLSTSGGNIHADQSSGTLTLSTSGGNIGLDDLSGNIKAETSGGNIGADNISGKLQTSSSGGNLSLRNMACALQAGTSGGNMDVTISKADQYIKLYNHGSGAVRVKLPRGLGMNLQASGRSVKVNDLEGFSGDIDEREVKGSVKGGGIPVTIDGGDSRVEVSN